MEFTYQRVGDYYLPNFTLPPQDNRFVGKYGLLRLTYLKEHRRVLYINYLTSCTLQQHLHEVNTQASEQVAQIMHDFATQEGTNEQLKATDQMEWVRRMNSYQARAEELVLQELIYM